MGRLWVFPWTPQNIHFKCYSKIECETEFDSTIKGLKYKCFNKSFIHIEHLYSATSRKGAVLKGRPQRRREGVWSNADRGVKDLVDVRKLVLFFIVSACFADTLYG